MVVILVKLWISYIDRLCDIPLTLGFIVDKVTTACSRPVIL